MMPVENHLLSLYRHIGSQAAEWANRVPLIADAGFNILSGPPIVGGPMVVLLNPGLSAEVQARDAGKFWPERWPKYLSLLRGVSPFAQKLIQIFDGVGIALECVNAGYVLVCRSKSFREWKAKVPLDVRNCAEQASLEALGTIVSTLEPAFIYAAGFSTFRRMGCSVE